MWPEEVKGEKHRGASPGKRGPGHRLSGNVQEWVVRGGLPLQPSPTVPILADGTQSSLWFGGLSWR